MPRKRRLPRHVRRNVMFTKMHRSDARRRQGGLCCYCSRVMTKHGPKCGASCTLEHVSPKAEKKFRPSDSSNYAASCQRCNFLKGPKTDEEFRAEWEGRWDEMPDDNSCKKCP